MEHDPLAPLVAQPRASALLFDVDGTLAPIAPHPDLAAVPEARLAALARLRDRYAAVGCVSGRPLSALRRLVPVDGLLLAGNHGLELDLGRGPERAPGADAWEARMAAVAARLEGPVREAGGWVEDKGLTLTLHWREAPEPHEAGRTLGALAAAEAEASGVELRPPRRPRGTRRCP